MSSFVKSASQAPQVKGGQFVGFCARNSNVHRMCLVLCRASRRLSQFGARESGFMPLLLGLWDYGFCRVGVFVALVLYFVFSDLFLD